MRRGAAREGRNASRKPAAGRPGLTRPRMRITPPSPFAPSPDVIGPVGQARPTGGPISPATDRRIANAVEPACYVDTTPEVSSPQTRRGDTLRQDMPGWDVYPRVRERRVLPRRSPRQVLGGEIPVEVLVDHRLEVIGPQVLVVEVIGVLPHVDRQQRVDAASASVSPSWVSSIESVPPLSPAIPSRWRNGPRRARRAASSASSNEPNAASILRRQIARPADRRGLSECQ